MKSCLSTIPTRIGIGTFFALTACASSAPTPDERPYKRTVVSASANPETVQTPTAAQQNSPDFVEYGEIQKLYASQAYDVALSKMEGFEARYPKSSLIAQVQNLRGLGLLLTHHPDQAVDQFRAAIARSSSNPGFLPFLSYNLAKAQFESGDLQGSEQTASQINPDQLDADNRLKFRFLRAGIFNKRKFNFEASKELLLASRDVKQMTPELRKIFETTLDASLQEIAGTAQLEDLYRENENAPLADAVLYRLGAKEMALGLTGRGEGHLRTLTARFPDSSYTSQAHELLKSTQNQEIDRRTVGVLLPLKGKFARFGQDNLHAIEMAFRIFDSKTADTGVQLVVEDSGDSSEQTVKALNRLVMKYHVTAVIGPLLSKGIDQVTRRAEELGVPLISLARHVGTSENYVIQSGMTLQMQTYEIARYAIENRGLRRFAIIHPKDPVGEESAQHFWDAVESLGGQIVGIESYSPSETDFREVVDKLSGLYYTEARQSELDELAKQRKLNQIKKRTRKTEQYFSLPPIVDYDAVFIPEDPKGASLILPTFAYRDVDHVQFLGTSAWNSPELIQRAQKDAEGALFVDAFYPGDRSPRVREFIEKFQGTFGNEPNAMDALAYDAALVLESALHQLGNSFSRSDLMDLLKHTRDVKGVTGKISFKDGQLTRDLTVLSIQGGQIMEETR